MNEEAFTWSVRKFLKHFGVTAQREIEGLPTNLVIEQDITLT